MALSFGFVFNLLVRRFVAVNEADQWDVRAVRMKVLGVVERVVGRLNRRKGEEVVKKDQ